MHELRVSRARRSTWIPAKNQKISGEEHRDIMEASVRTSARPDCRARGPGLPSSSSMRRVPGRRLAVKVQQSAAGRLALRKRMLSQADCERLVTPATYQ